MQIILTVVEGPHRGQTFTFERHDHFFVGRSKIAHFQLPDSDLYFSRMHFMVEVNPPACRLLDLDSTNGTLVNGQPVLSVDLKHGDLIKGGDTAFKVTVCDHEGSDNATVTRVRGSDSEVIADPLPGTPPKIPATAEHSNDPVANGWTAPGYEIGLCLGTGGMGVVYRARRIADGTPVALKILRPNVVGRRTEIQRFLREIEILGQLSHPAIVALIDAGENDGLLYFAMEFVEAIDAKKWVERQPKPLPIKVAVGIICRVLTALEFAHKKGFVHRDVKPNNILIQQNGKELRVKLADFGLARAYQESAFSGLTMTGDICGTPKLMAPEQILNSRQVQPTSDQYSAAATLYWLLTKQFTHNFGTKVHDALNQILLGDPVPVMERRTDVPPALEAVLHRALQKEPSARYPSVAVFRKELKNALNTRK